MPTSLLLNIIKSVNKFLPVYLSSYCRHFSTLSQNGPTNKQMFRLLYEHNVKNKRIPYFEALPSQVEIIHHPKIFYDSIIKLIRSAKQRICISSLYIGTGQKEKALINEIYNALKTKPNVNVTILLDYGRSLREENGINSVELLSKLVMEFPKKCKLAFIVNPRITNLHSYFPGVISEATGVLHSKILICDDNTILTGANLSQSYFTNRQDRYYLVNSVNHLANFCENYINSLASVAYCANPHGKLVLPLGSPNPFKEKKKYIDNIKENFNLFISKHKVIPIDDKLSMATNNNNLVFIFPSFQFSDIQVTDDQQLLSSLFASNCFSKVKIASGYLNLTDFFIKWLHDGKFNLDIVTSSPQANSFFNGGFLKKNIPYLYRVYEKNLLNAMSTVNLYEYRKTNWTFHSKGIWVYENISDRPSMTVIGSSNFNYRSFVRDIETQFYFYSRSPEFSARLEAEARHSFNDSILMPYEAIANDKDMQLRLRHRLMARLLEKFF